MAGHELIPGARVSIRAWTRGVEVDEKARAQLLRMAELPFVHHHIAVMPDVHWGLGATIGSVLPTIGAIVPAAVGVDIGCGMAAVRTTLMAKDLPDALGGVRRALERAVPHGRGGGRRGGKGRDPGSWGTPPKDVLAVWRRELAPGFARLCERHPVLERSNHVAHLGTLGTGNHFLEVCLDEAERVWIMLHSGSRGVGNKIARVFIELAKQALERELGSLPDADLAWLEEGRPHFDDYVEAVGWAQDFARWNRDVMMGHALRALATTPGLPPFDARLEAVNCHHNYVAREHHFGRDCFVTRKGAVRAGKGELGIIPGSMGTKSFIVRGKGNAESFASCSHGAGRVLSRTQAKRRFTLADHAAATAHVECRKDAGVLDETPGAYKDIDAVLAAQADLVEIVHTLRQVVCVKG